MSLTRGEPDEGESAQVETFLRSNPGWLALRPELYGILIPPERVHGEHLADHMTAMIRRERARAAEMAERANGVLAAGRAVAGLAARVQEAVLALLRCADPLDCICQEMPGILAIDAIHLCAEWPLTGAQPVPAGTVEGLLNGRHVLRREVATEARLLHAEAAGLGDHDVLVRVPGEGSPALLALIARDGHAIDSPQGTAPLVFLGRAVAARLGRG
jgi:uncharacterized protein YigA (DUF484 family)